MDKAGGDAVSQQGPYKMFSDAAKVGRIAMEKDVETAMRCFVNMDEE